jgi:hypothetical protein
VSLSAGKWIKTYRQLHPVTKQPWMCDVAYERFLGLARELSHASLALTAYDV